MAQNLTTNIVINAKTGNGFSQVGATLTELGTLVNGISQKLINFGEDSVKVYREYEKSMKDAEVALSTTYGRNTQQLSKVMKELDETATEWAATTIFHTNDVANAIAEASHAGWDLDQILTGIPAAMQLAQAGSLDLSEAVNYIVKSTSAAGVNFDDLTYFTDLWTFAANSSASTIGEFGDAMLRMGSTMRFTGSTEELMTLIAMTANAGSVGSEAGTMIRNSIMRLIAPTQKADKAMSQLGATSEETAELLENEALAAANAELAAHGFSAFDSSGNMKNILDIYNELYVALGEIAGGYENIEKNESALSILSSIFPTRTITEALTLLRAAANEYDGLYDAMRGGAARGYGAYAADTMMDSLNGRIETFNSKVERLKQLVGAELAPQLGSVLEFGGDLVDSLAEIDPDLFGALVKGFEVIAGAGPGLLIAGGALRLIGALLTPAGAIATGIIALTAAAVAIKDFQDSKFADNFGNMDLDTSAITEHIRQLGDGFRETYGEVNKFREYLNEAVSDYENASSQFSSDLMTKMITGVQLTEEDKTALENLGNDMYEAVQTAIASSAAGEMNYLQALFGGENGNLEDNPAYQELLGLANSAYEEAMAQAEEISRGLSEALTSAFSDGEISAEEYQNILSYMRSYNDAIARAEAEAQSEQAYIERKRILQKAQTASKDEISDISKELTGARDEMLAQSEDQFWDNYWRAESRGASDSALAEMQQKHEAEIAALRAPYDQDLMNLWGTAIGTSDQGDNYAAMQKIVSQYMSGEMTEFNATKQMEQLLGTKSPYAGKGGWGANKTDRAQLGRMLGTWITAMGGDEAVQQMILGGDTDVANMYAMAQLVNGWTTTWGEEGQTSAMIQNGRGGDNRAAAEAALASQMPEYSVGTARRTISAYTDELGGFFDEVGRIAVNGTTEYAATAFDRMGQSATLEYYNIMDQLQGAYDFEKVASTMNIPSPVEGWTDQLVAWELMFGEASTHLQDFKIGVEPEVNTAGIEEQLPDSTQITVEPVIEGGDSVDSLGGQGVEVSVSADASQLSGAISEQDGQMLTELVGGDTAELAGAIDEQDGRNLTETVDGNTWPLARSINAQNGRSLTENVYGNITGLKNSIDSQDGRHITVVVDQVEGSKVGYASGGRATEASIFGEAGPEWAIPEEHTQRTAELLNAAREASGFTWGDLLSRFGGLNANPKNVPATIVYSPTVHAQDARGVDAVLREDKKRLERWFEEKQLLDRVEVYA